MKVRKFIKTLGVTMAIATMFTVPALAQRMSFDLTVYDEDEDGDGHIQYTDTNPKDDDEQASHVHIQGGNLTYNDDFRMGVSGPTGYDYTGNVSVTPRNLDPVLSFYKGYAEANTPLRLRAVTYAYQVNVYGYWYS